MSEDKGPSKNELKKMAKKAEKAAKKAAMKAAAGGGPAPAESTSDAKSSGKAANSMPVTKKVTPIPLNTAPPKVLLYQGARDDPATLKAVWASLHYKIELGVAKKKNLPAGCSPGKKCILIYGTGDYVLGGGGNAMVKAIGLMAGEPLSFEADEWCEVERNTLRNADAKKPLNLDSLATVLDNSISGVHLVGEAVTIADICVMVTLSKHASDASTWPGKFRTFVCS